jgi:hypothetical protein
MVMPGFVFWSLMMPGFPGVWAFLLRSCSEAFVVSFSVWLAALDSSTPTPRRVYVYLFPLQYFRRFD